MANRPRPITATNVKGKTREFESLTVASKVLRIKIPNLHRFVKQGGASRGKHKGWKFGYLGDTQ